MCNICEKQEGKFSMLGISGKMCTTCHDAILKARSGNIEVAKEYFNSVNLQSRESLAFIQKELSIYEESIPEDNVYSLTDTPQYVVLQVTLKEKFIGTGSGNLTELEDVINKQAAKGYRLHTITTTSSHSTGLGGGDRIQATMIFEKLPS